MATRPPHSRPAHPHLAGLPSLQEEPAPASGTTPTPRARRSTLPRGSARLQSVGSGHVASAPVENEAPRAANDDPFHIGRTLAGRYRIEQLLGEGSMGAVVRALHLGLDEPVAIKLIRREQRHDPLAVARFAREAKALARLKSEHIPRLFDVGRSLGIGPYIVMEYLEGRDLGEVLRSEGALDAPRAVGYVLEACEALAVAHGAGITHQDLKPENLFLARHGQVESIKLLDFGISKGSLDGRIFGEDLTRSSAPFGLMGTPLYMSPERVRNEADLDHRSDIWSLGIVLHELVTGRTPFGGESVTEICAQVLEDASPPLATGSLPPPLEAVILRCLSHDPNERFQTIEDLAAALAPLAPPPETFFGRLSQQMPRVSLAPDAPSPALAEAGLTATRRPLAFALLPALAAAVLGVAFNLSDRGGSGVVATAPTPREDLAAETTFVVLAWGPAPQRRPDIPSTAAVPVAPRSTAKPIETGNVAVSPDLDSTPVGHVRLLEDRPRLRLVEDNPRLPSRHAHPARSAGSTPHPRAHRIISEPPKSSSKMRSRPAFSAGTPRTPGVAPEPYLVR
jgi:eukaryotic-like serine/threonine-protein kinase